MVKMSGDKPFLSRYQSFDVLVNVNITSFVSRICPRTTKKLLRNENMRFRDDSKRPFKALMHPVLFCSCYVEPPRAQTKAN